MINCRNFKFKTQVNYFKYLKVNNAYQSKHRKSTLLSPQQPSDQHFQWLHGKYTSSKYAQALLSSVVVRSLRAWLKVWLLVAGTSVIPPKYTYRYQLLVWNVRFSLLNSSFSLQVYLLGGHWFFYTVLPSGVWAHTAPSTFTACVIVPFTGDVFLSRIAICCPVPS